MNILRVLTAILIPAVLPGIASAQDATAEPPAPAEPPADISAGLAADELFENADVPTDSVAAIPPGNTIKRTVRFREDALANLTPGKPVVLDAEKPDIWRVRSIRKPAPNLQIVNLSLDNDSTGHAAFVTYGEVTAMRVSIGSTGEIYRLQSLGDGLYQVWQFDMAAIEPEECFHLTVAPSTEDTPPRVLDESDDDWLPGDPVAAPDGAGCAGSEIPIFDTMILYTPAARAAIGGHTAMRAEAALAVELANVAYANSNNAVRARLVYCDEIDYKEAEDEFGGADMDTDLTRLRGQEDGFMDEIHDLRDALNADLVAMFTNTGSGLGNCPTTPNYNRAFSVTKWTRAAGTLTHAHETGHNAGCGHNQADFEACDGGPTYNKGWRFRGEDFVNYCTVMSYTGGGIYERMPYYSNPNVELEGTPTGVPIGEPDEAFNARVIANNDTDIANYELTRYDIYVWFDNPSGLQFGTASFPFDTMTEGVSAIDVPEVGATELPNLYITEGTTTWTGTIDKVMRIEACGGTVRIGG